MSETPDPASLPDFSHVSRQKVEGKLRWFSIPCVAPKARVQGRCAHQSSNLPLSAAQLRASATSYPKPDEKDWEAIARDRSRSFDLFAEHVLVGWEGVVDAKGEPVAFSTATAAGLLRALPEIVFQDLRVFFILPRNFEGEIDAAAVSGNSSAGSSGS